MSSCAASGPRAAVSGPALELVGQRRANIGLERAGVETIKQMVVETGRLLCHLCTAVASMTLTRRIARAKRGAIAYPVELQVRHTP